MGAGKKIKSKAKVKRAGAKVLRLHAGSVDRWGDVYRALAAPNTYPRKDGACRT